MANPWDMDPIVRKQDPWDLDPVVGRTPVQETAETYTPSREPAPESNPIRALQLGAQSVGRGLGNLVTGPIAITNMAANGLFGLADMASQAAGGPEIPFRFQTDHGERLAEGAGDLAQAFGVDVIPWEDRTASERLRGNIQSFGTEALAGSSALASRVPQLAQKITAGGTPSVFDNLVRPYMDNLGAVAGDTVAGMGAGVGSTVAEEYAPDNPWAQLLGALVGGVGGATGVEATRGVAHGTKRAFNSLFADRNIPLDPMTGAPVSRAVAESAARTTQDAARDPVTGANRAPAAAATIRDNATRFKDEGLPVPTSGLISENIGLQQQEAALRTRNSAAFRQADDRVHDAVADRVNALRDPAADQSAVPAAATQRSIDLRAERDDAALPLLRAAQERGATVDAQPIADLIDGMLSTVKRPAVRSALKEARESLNAVGSDELDTSVSGLYETRKTINDIIEGRSETSTGRFAQSELVEVRDALDNAINEVAPEFGDYLARFREGSKPLDDLRESASVARVLGEDDPREALRPILSGKRFDAEEQLDQIVRAMGDDEEAMRGLKAAVADVLSEQVTGTVKSSADPSVYRASLAKLDAAFKRHRATLARVFSPEEMNMLQQSHAALEVLKNALVRASGGSNTADKMEQVWRITEAGLKARYGVLKGGGILRTLRIAAETLPSDRSAIERLIERASLDPQIAEYLLTRKVGNLDANASNKWVRRALAVNAAGRAGGGDDEP